MDRRKLLKYAICAVSGLLVIFLIIWAVQTANRPTAARSQGKNESGELTAKSASDEPGHELRLKEIICTLPDGTSYTYARPQYRKDGKIELSEGVFSDGAIKNKEIYTYDDNGLLSEESLIFYYQYTGSVDHSWTTFYEAGSEKVKERELYDSYNEAGGNLNHSETIYQNGVKQSEHSVGYTENGECDYVYEKRFDSHGEIVWQSFDFYSDGKSSGSPTISTYVNEYDENGNITYAQQIDEKNSGSYAEDFFEYTFDQDGRILSKIQTLHHGYKSEYIDDDYSYVRKWFYKYDGRGNRLEDQYILSTEDEPDMVNSKTVYTYNEYDRILSREEYEKGEFQARYDYVYE